MNIKFLCAMVFAVALIYSAPNVYAAGTVVNGQIGATSKEIGSAAARVSIAVSKGVKLSYFGNATAYSSGAFHQSGTREFGTSSRLQTLYYIQCNASDPNDACGPDHTAGAGTTTTTLDISGNWTSH